MDNQRVGLADSDFIRLNYGVSFKSGGMINTVRMILLGLFFIDEYGISLKSIAFSITYFIVNLKKKIGFWILNQPKPDF